MASGRFGNPDTYQKAKEVILGLVTSAQRLIQTKEFYDELKHKYPSLCDDSTPDPSNPRRPYWQHQVDSALQSLKKSERIANPQRGYWGQGGGTPSPIPQPRIPVIPPQEPQPSVAGDVREQLKGKLLRLAFRPFELVIGELLKSMGFNVQVTGRTGDGGIDGIGTIPVFNVKVVFQAKRWDTHQTVGADPVRSLIGAVVANRHDRGIFITTSSFTAGAKEEADKPDSRVVLIDGEKLIDIMIARGLGIRKVPVVKEELDEGFFEGLTT